MSKPFKFGELRIDPAAYGSQGSAILGIRDSGKSYTATALAEKLYEAGVPFIAFDPIGLWRFLRVPGKGRGYPIVVAGGQAGDLPLNVASAPKIVEAAMQSGVSLVIDLFDINLSKADWRRIVKDCVRLLLHRNKQHGLRHIFLEEAAEFAPQKVLDGDVYAEIEKLARMGGNSRLGYTLINQRSQEVNKAVLELCENLFLHRQKGKNAIVGLNKWLDVGGVKDFKAITDGLPTLGQGECWAWMEGVAHAVHLHVPSKNSLHPDRRVMHGDEAALKAPVDVDAFVSTMKRALPAIEEEAKANDPKALKAEVAKLKGQLAIEQRGGAILKANLEKAVEIAKTAPAGLSDATMTKAVDAASAEGYAKGFLVGNEEGYRRGWKDAQKEDRAIIQGSLADLVARLPDVPERIYTPPAPKRAPVIEHVAPLPKQIRAIASANDAQASDITGPGLKVLAALAFWKDLGFEAPTKKQIGAAAGYTASGSSLRGALAGLSTAGLIAYPSTGTVSVTPQGLPHLPPVEAGSVRSKLTPVLTGPSAKVLDVLLASTEPMTKDEIGAATGYEATGSSLRGALAGLSTLGLVNYQRAGVVAIEEWVRL